MEVTRKQILDGYKSELSNNESGPKLLEASLKVGNSLP